MKKSEKKLTFCFESGSINLIALVPSIVIDGKKNALEKDYTGCEGV